MTYYIAEHQPYHLPLISSVCINITSIESLDADGKLHVFWAQSMDYTVQRMNPHYMQSIDCVLSALFQDCASCNFDCISYIPTTFCSC